MHFQLYKKDSFTW